LLGLRFQVRCERRDGVKQDVYNKLDCLFYSCCFMTILQTITGLVDGVVKLIKTEFGYDLLDALMGFENAPRIINSLLSHSSTILSGRRVI
jgi:hypothetical protein